jgi:hypothetical protein
LANLASPIPVARLAWSRRWDGCGSSPPRGRRLHRLSPCRAADEGLSCPGLVLGKRA